MNNQVHRYARLVRLSTDSELTVKLPQPMRPLVAEAWLAGAFPDWAWEFLDSDNPDGIHADYGYKHFDSVFE